MLLDTFFGGLMNMGIGALNNIWAHDQQKDIMGLNYKLNEQAAENADKRTRALYQDFYSPQALLNQYQKAGLSPSLMYGGTPGQGGMSGAQGGGASGQNAMYVPMNMLEGAQIAKLMAETEKTKAETEVIKPEASAHIEQMLANAGHEKAAGAAAEAQAAGQKLHNYITEQTKEASIYRICEEADEAGYRAEQAFNEMRSAKVLADINEATYNEQVQLKKKELEAVTQSIVESKATVRLKDQERRKLYNDILGMWDDLDRKWKELDVSQQQVDTYTDWINSQIPIIEKQLEVRLKELGIEKDRMIIEAVTGTIKSLAFGAMAAASFAGGKGSNATPAGAADVLKKKGASGGHATTPRDKVPVYKNDYTWGF